MSATIIEQFRRAMADKGLAYSQDNRHGIEADADKIKRYHIEGDSRKSLNGWYILHTDGLPAGEFGSWKAGVSYTWCGKAESTLTPDELAELARKREADKARRDAAQRERHQAAARLAADIWESAQPADDGHPYLERKGVRAHGLRVGRWTRANEDGEIWLDVADALLVPLRRGKSITSLQGIFPSKDNAIGRDKDYLPGGEKRGCYFAIGKPSGDTPTIVICEGYATGATIFEATGFPVLVAFDAGNLEPVAVQVRERFPFARILVAADNDRWTMQPMENPGVTYAKAAAKACKGEVCVPEFQDLGSMPTDFNDLAILEGVDAVRAQIDPKPAEVGDGQGPAPTPANDNSPRPLDIFAEFPAPAIKRDMLPAQLEAYAMECSELIGVDPAMVAIPALVACAAALHDDVKIQPKRHETGWTESARLWCAIVGTPSVKKSPAIRRATKRLRKIDKDLADENAKVAADHASQMEQWKDAKKEAKKLGGGALPAPERPPMRRMIVEDITVEALSEVLKDNSRGVLCIQDELSGWFGSMDAYTGGKAGNKDRAAWLQAYNGGFRQVDRVMRGSVHIPNFSVSMIGGIQPDAIRRIAKDMTDDGLMQRFMIVIGRNAPEYDRLENLDVNRAFSDLVDHLHRVEPGAEPVRLTEGAHKVRERLMHYAGELADYPALPGGLRSHLGKWSGLFARLLLIYHAIECAGRQVHPSQRDVSEATAERVERLMRDFLLPHAMAYYTDILGCSGELEHARWVAGFILSRGLNEVQNRDLIQAYKQWRGMDDWRRQRVMQVLEDMGWCQPVVLEGSPHNKRGAHIWMVNPVVHELFADKAAEEAERRTRLREEVAAMQKQARA